MPNNSYSQMQCSLCRKVVNTHSRYDFPVYDPRTGFGLCKQCIKDSSWHHCPEKSWKHIMANMFGGNMNMNGMMKKVQKLQKQMTQMQEDLKKRTVEVTAGGGAVKIVMSGEKEVKDLKIDPAAVDPEDVEMLQDLLSAAFNEATKKVDEMMANEMGKLTGGMGLPPGLF